MPLESFLHSRPQDTSKPQHHKTFPTCQSHEILPNTAGPQYPSQQGSTSESSLTQQVFRIIFFIEALRILPNPAAPQNLLNMATPHFLPKDQPFRILNTAALQNHFQHGSPSDSSTQQPLRILLNMAAPQMLPNAITLQQPSEHRSPSEPS